MDDQNDRYNFDYFDQMNQKEAERKKHPNPKREDDAKQKPAKNKKQTKKQKRQGKDPAQKQKQKAPSRPKQKTAQRPDNQNQKPQASGGKTPPNGRPIPQKMKAQATAKQKQKLPKGADPLPKKKQVYLSPEERKRVMRRRKLLLAMGGIFAVLLITMILCLTVLFRIDTIEVSGASRYSSEQIVEASAVKKGQNLFTLNEGKACDEVVKTLPYVNTVTITRHLPGTIVLEVTDVTVVGAVKTGQGYVVIGTNGKMLEQVEKLPEHCPLLKGVTLTKFELGEPVEYEDEQQKKAMDAFSAALESGEIDKITEIDISDLYNIKAVYDNRIHLSFGLATDMEFKFRFAKAILDSDKVSDTQKGTLDLSLVSDKNRAYFDPDYTVGKDDEDTSSDASSTAGTTDEDQHTSEAENSSSSAPEDGETDPQEGGEDAGNGIPDGLTQDADGYYYDADGYYDENGNFTPYE